MCSPRCSPGCSPFGAAEFEVDYKAGEEHVVAFHGTVGSEVMNLPSNSDAAGELRTQLYALAEKPRKITHAGVAYVLRVEVFDSFGEDAFRVHLARS